MKLNTLLISGFLIMILLIGGFGFYNSTQLSEFAEVSRKVTEATEISQAALDFNVENFHTQLEVWEYAYEPTEKRLKAFEGHDEKLTELLDILVETVEEESGEEEGHGALIEGGEEQIKGIAADLEKVRADWVGLLASIEELQKAKEQGQPHDILDQLEDAARAKVLANEDLFDELEFNKKIDEFVVAQEELLQESIIKGESLEATISTFRTITLIIIGLLLVIGLGMGLFISRSVSKPLAKLTNAVEEVSRGRLDITIEKSNIDEVNKLAEALERVMTTMKRAIKRMGKTSKTTSSDTEEVESNEEEVEEEPEDKDFMKMKKQFEQFQQWQQGMKKMGKKK